jgi:predicted alpha/beta-hydrolase family hydrolase
LSDRSDILHADTARYAEDYNHSGKSGDQKPPDALLGYLPVHHTFSVQQIYNRTVPADTCLILTHGAGSNRNAPMLVRVAKAFEEQGITVNRIDLPYRVNKPTGPPPPGSAERDREGIAQAITTARRNYPRVFIGGHSYGGRQCSMLAAERAGIADGLVLFAYPLRPPRSKSAAARTVHFAELKTRAIFFHGTRDPFGSPEELAEALTLIPAETRLVTSDRDGHELARLDGALVASEFKAFFME